MARSHENQAEPLDGQKISRRNFMKAGCATGLAAISISSAALGSKAEGTNSLKGKKLGMVIDLQRCTGCGGCAISCKSENNVQAGVKWSTTVSKTVGIFPNIRFDFYPTLCNHCENAPCVRACPTGAMHKADGDITMHTPDKCIGCGTCRTMCPYGVISFNSKETHSFWSGKKATIEGCTSAPAEVVQKVKGNRIPHYNPSRERATHGAGLRSKGIVEKCTLCHHLLQEGKLPFCVTSCPASARIFGDLNDPNSAASKLINRYLPRRLKEHLGTEPKVYYLRAFNPGNYHKTKGSI